MVRPPYRVAVRLHWIAAERWAEIEAAYYMTDLLRVGRRKFLNLVYAWVVERVPHDKMDDWLVQLNDLLPDEDADSEAAIELESESFAAFSAKGGGG